MQPLRALLAISAVVHCIIGQNVVIGDQGIVARALITMVECRRRHFRLSSGAKAETAALSAMYWPHLVLRRRGTASLHCDLHPWGQSRIFTLPLRAAAA